MQNFIKKTLGLQKPCYLLTKVKYLSNDIETAENLLKNCIDKNNNTSEAYLLLAQVRLIIKLII